MARGVPAARDRLRRPDGPRTALRAHRGAISTFQQCDANGCSCRANIRPPPRRGSNRDGRAACRPPCSRSLAAARANSASLICERRHCGGRRRAGGPSTAFQPGRGWGLAGDEPRTSERGALIEAPVIGPPKRASSRGCRRSRSPPAGHCLTADSVPGSIYAGPISGVMTWRSNQFNRLLRGTWAYTAP